MISCSSLRAFGVWGTKRGRGGGGGGGGNRRGSKLQALVYDILPWRKVPESDARSVEGIVAEVDGFQVFVVHEVIVGEGRAGFESGSEDLFDFISSL